jgi:cytochrome c oxidase subunit I
MFFPFVGCVAESLATFTGRRFFGYPGTVLSLLAFAALSMSVWGHHLFASGQATNDYFSLTSILLILPPGIEYSGMLATLVGARLSYPTPMLFALAFIPQFLISGLRDHARHAVDRLPGE